MEWNKCYLDVILVPLGLMACVGYHLWLWHKIRTQPLSTVFGTNARARKLWVASIMKDNDKKNVLAVQSLRNTIMGSTLIATTSILMASGLAAVISSTYSIKKPLNDNVYGAHGEFMVSLKYVSLLLIFLISFICHSLSISFINEVNYLINCPADDDDTAIITPPYIAALLERGLGLNAFGNRVFYIALPLITWIFGPVLVFLCSLTMLAVLYNLDFVLAPPEKGKTGAAAEISGHHSA